MTDRRYREGERGRERGKIDRKDIGIVKEVCTGRHEEGKLREREERRRDSVRQRNTETDILTDRETHRQTFS